MSRAITTLCLGLLLSVGAASAQSPVPLATPTSLKRTSLRYDPTVFELVEDTDDGTGGDVTLTPVDGLAVVGLREFLDVPANVTAEGALDTLNAGETEAQAPFALEGGPAGWTCSHAVADLKAPGVDSVFRCVVKDGDDMFLLSVITNEHLTPPALLAELRTLLATVRVLKPAP